MKPQKDLEAAAATFSELCYDLPNVDWKGIRNLNECLLQCHCLDDLVKKLDICAHPRFPQLLRSLFWNSQRDAADAHFGYVGRADFSEEPLSFSDSEFKENDSGKKKHFEVSRLVLLWHSRVMILVAQELLSDIAARNPSEGATELNQTCTSLNKTNPLTIDLFLKNWTGEGTKSREAASRKLSELLQNKPDFIRAMLGEKYQGDIFTLLDRTANADLLLLRMHIQESQRDSVNRNNNCNEDNRTQSSVAILNKAALDLSKASGSDDDNDDDGMEGMEEYYRMLEKAHASIDPPCDSNEDEQDWSALCPETTELIETAREDILPSLREIFRKLRYASFVEAFFLKTSHTELLAQSLIYVSSEVDLSEFSLFWRELTSCIRIVLPSTINALIGTHLHCQGSEFYDLLREALRHLASPLLYSHKLFDVLRLFLSSMSGNILRSKKLVESKMRHIIEECLGFSPPLPLELMDEILDKTAMSPTSEILEDQFPKVNVQLHSARLQLGLFLRRQKSLSARGLTPSKCLEAIQENLLEIAYKTDSSEFVEVEDYALRCIPISDELIIFTELLRIGLEAHAETLSDSESIEKIKSRFGKDQSWVWARRAIHKSFQHLKAEHARLVQEVEYRNDHMGKVLRDFAKSLDDSFVCRLILEDGTSPCNNSLLTFDGDEGLNGHLKLMSDTEKMNLASVFVRTREVMENEKSKVVSEKLPSALVFRALPQSLLYLWIRLVAIISDVVFDDQTAFELLRICKQKELGKGVMSLQLCLMEGIKTENELRYDGETRCNDSNQYRNHLIKRKSDPSTVNDEEKTLRSSNMQQHSFARQTKLVQLGRILLINELALSWRCQICIWGILQVTLAPIFAGYAPHNIVSATENKSKVVTNDVAESDLQELEVLFDKGFEQPKSNTEPKQVAERSEMNEDTLFSMFSEICKIVPNFQNDEIYVLTWYINTKIVPLLRKIPSSLFNLISTPSRDRFDFLLQSLQDWKSTDGPPLVETELRTCLKVLISTFDSKFARRSESRSQNTAILRKHE